MTIALVIVIAVYLAVASLTALNSTLEAERAVLTAKDFTIIALVSVAWPIVGCVLLLATVCRKAFPKKALVPAGGALTRTDCLEPGGPGERLALRRSSFRSKLDLA